MNAKSLAAIAAAAALAAAVAHAQQPAPMMGFSAQGAERERAAERIMSTVPNADRMKEIHRAITLEPHVVGSKTNYDYAVYLADKYKALGFDVKMNKYDVYIPWPGNNRVSLTFPEKVDLSLTEPSIPEDPDSAHTKGALPAFAAYVGSGDVEGELVYVNYGRIEDYRLLDRMGVSLKGKIAIARYGGQPSQMRGMKTREAYKRGAIGSIVYSDPADDGYVRGDVYPKGRYRPSTGFERGSFLDVPIYPGDPLTPGTPSIPGVERIAPEAAESIQKIPTIVISYGEAQKLLVHLQAGEAAPRGWQGGLPLTYHIGPGPAKVSMHIENDYQQRPVWNVIASLRGSVEPERIVMAAGHRDAWVMGAADPTSGAASLLETARAISTAVKQGFRPRRTIQLGSWDGEEFFLLGSTEHGEQFGDDLKKNMVVYMNRESYGAGNWGVDGNSSLEKWVIETTKDASHPSGKSLYDAWVAQQPNEPIRLDALGSGSDYTVFIDHLGVPSLGPGFSGGASGVRHSLYDTFAAYQKYGDPGYKYGVSQADTIAKMLMRLASADVLPFEYTATADYILRELDDLQGLDTAGQMRGTLAGLAAAAAGMRESAVDANAAIETLLASPAAGRDKVLPELNGLVMQVERDFTDQRGLPRRPWYKYLLTAPGYYTGYAAKTLPGVREAMEEQQWDLAKEQAAHLSEAISRAKGTIEKAAALARQGAGAAATASVR
ncbi:MAG: M28 family peptidase [Acidobacteria bacterium]|nr:M28 family peptidase [Acidobacteriota bacterium]